MPEMSAMAWAASGMESISHWIRTTALTMVSLDRSRSLQRHGHAHPAADAQRGQPQRVPLLAHLVGAREHDPGPGHPDGVPDGDGAVVGVQPVLVELQLPIAG